MQQWRLFRSSDWDAIFIGQLPKDTLFFWFNKIEVAAIWIPAFYTKCLTFTFVFCCSVVDVLSSVDAFFFGDSWAWPRSTAQAFFYVSKLEKLCNKMKAWKTTTRVVFDQLHTNEPPMMSQRPLYSSLRKLHLELNWSLNRKNWHSSWLLHASWQVTASAWVPFLIMFDLSSEQPPNVISLHGSSINALNNDIQRKF